MTATPNRSKDLEAIRKTARILVIDDQDSPKVDLFKRDGYHIERWPAISNLARLTDGHYDVILLDIHGVGLDESPGKQGLGILQHVKHTNPAQAVVVYSARPQGITNRNVLMLADEVMDKDQSYVEFKQVVDDLLKRRQSAGYFIGAMNRELSDDALLVPWAVWRARRALRSGRTESLGRYLATHLRDEKKVDRILTIISIGASVATL